MALYRVRLNLAAPLGTPLTSGTIFGHLCWAKLRLDGEARFAEWLATAKAGAWAVSDGMPADRLPRPLLAPTPRPGRARGESKKDYCDRLDRMRDRARRAWITRAHFLHHRERLTPQALDSFEEKERIREGELGARAARLAHNTIDRLTGTTPARGGLYFVDEDWSFHEDPDRDVYVRTDEPASEVERLFGHVGESGFGRDASLGRGRFSVRVEGASALDGGRGRRRLSLSHGTITPNMGSPRYRLFTHYGKVGPEMNAEIGRPWKRPLLLTRPGLTFDALDEGPFGAWLDGVHQDRPEIGHNAFHVVLAFEEAEP